MNYDLLKKLVESFGPSGYEDQVREMIRPEIAAYADEIKVDTMGNLIVHKKGNGLKVMVAAHTDEIGLMTTHITEKGFLRFTNIGGVRLNTLTGNRVQFADGRIGIIHSEPIDDASKLQPMSKHFIDVGATGRDNCPVRVGTPAGFKGEFIVQGQYLTSKTMDDRIGCYIAIETLKRLTQSPHDLTIVFSTQEEVGTRGAQVVANTILPDVGIALDVTTTGDTPEARPMAVRLGGGAAIKVKDTGMIAHAGLVSLMQQRAEEANILYQFEVLEGGSTDARAMQIAGPGCAAGCISIPCRNVHTQSETVQADDVENCIQLLLAILSNPISLS